MGDSVKLNTFPSSRAEALTMLYLENQNLSGTTPEEIAEKYQEVYLRIRESLNALAKERRSTL